jgi:drug/metabolite transporter (DMT)-like permease
MNEIVYLALLLLTAFTAGVLVGLIAARGPRFSWPADIVAPIVARLCYGLVIAILLYPTEAREQRNEYPAWQRALAGGFISGCLPGGFWGAPFAILGCWFGQYLRLGDRID